jgi:uncharacterized membrane protein (UPF0127 family)
MRRISAVVIVLLATSCAKSAGTTSDAPSNDMSTRSTSPAPPATPDRRSTITLTGSKGPVIVHAEVVTTPGAQEKGLMYREYLAPDAAMLFPMGFVADHRFWMRNTLIPLDMIFISRELEVVGIVEKTTPLTDDGRQCGKPSWYVLEVNGGWSAEHGIAAGAKVTIDKLADQFR